MWAQLVRGAGASAELEAFGRGVSLGGGSKPGSLLVPCGGAGAAALCCVRAVYEEVEAEAEAGNSDGGGKGAAGKAVARRVAVVGSFDDDEQLGLLESLRVRDRRRNFEQAKVRLHEVAVDALAFVERCVKVRAGLAH